MVFVWVLRASEHHSPQEIADRIGRRLRLNGHHVETQALPATSDRQWPSPGEGLVLGSAVHDGAWLPAAEHFVRINADRLGGQPTWMFSAARRRGQVSAVVRRPRRRARVCGQWWRPGHPRPSR
ncbi:flavodoxin domain-containing protein [Streptomyces sp. NPDC101191]|uniref:flavodoxin domain-containing protein n=1 Tax=Streptomyces sp. NPDC101191 TaxID=3366126 RepID=UPI00382C7DC2